MIIRGDTHVADLYLVEFLRLYNHFSFRYTVQQMVKKVTVGTRAWWSQGSPGALLGGTSQCPHSPSLTRARM